MKVRFAIIFLFLYSSHVYSQAVREWENILYQLGEIEDTESSTWEPYYDMLCELEQNPININTATREELEELPFLTSKDVEDISEYIYRYGPMKSLGELVMVRDLDYDKRKLLFYFTYAGEAGKKGFPQIKNILKYGKHDIIGTFKVPFYDRKGDIKGYEGYKYKHGVRYDFTYGDYVRAGFLGAQDSGEPFFAGKNSMGYDFYSFYVVLKKLGRIKTLALGRYRLRFGMGLVVNNNFSFGKLSALSSLGRGGNSIRAHSSRSESNYFQGAASTVNIAKGLDVSAFVSYRKFDATLNKDSTIATILSSGYHRTRTELGKKNNSSHIVAGGNADFSRSGFHVGATAVFTSLDKKLKPKTDAVYRRHYASGKDFYNVGVYYGYTGSRFSVNGETATGDSRAIATINTISCNIGEKVELMALQRFYSFRYYSLFSESFSEGGSVQNESGVYLGLTWRPNTKMNIMAYSDFAYFAWPKYQASNSSRSFDNLVQMSYANGHWNLNARYRLKLREKDNDKKDALVYSKEHRGRMAAAYNNGMWKLKTQADVVFSEYKTSSFGWMITQSAAYNLRKRLNVIASIGYFNTDDYSSRVYSYEPSLPYSFYYPSYYGSGIRYSLYAEYGITKKLGVTAKLGTVKYLDRSTIGSSYQMINHSSATDMELQLRLRL